MSTHCCRLKRFYLLGAPFFIMVYVCAICGIQLGATAVDRHTRQEYHCWQIWVKVQRSTGQILGPDPEEARLAHPKKGQYYIIQKNLGLEIMWGKSFHAGSSALPSLCIQIGTMIPFVGGTCVQLMRKAVIGMEHISIAGRRRRPTHFQNSYM